jgi:hypothetical protein
MDKSIRFFGASRHDDDMMYRKRRIEGAVPFRFDSKRDLKVADASLMVTVISKSKSCTTGLVLRVKNDDARQ